MKRKHRKRSVTAGIHGAFATQAISSPDRHLPQSGVSVPADERVRAAREWCEEHKT
ncbi:MAG: hypothetical protein IKI50_06450 [Clostridia bacterium]|nr:hypothetical protein [Clostridia bacterium]